MGKDNNIHIKLEISRDKNSGELNIITHFDFNAPNVFNDEEGYFWIPTEAEKDLISDSFELMPLDKTKPSLEKIEIISTRGPKIRQEPESMHKPEPEEKAEPLPEFDKQMPPIPPLEEPPEKTGYEIAQQPDLDTDKKKDETPPVPKEEEKPDKETKEEDEGMIVKADEKAIEDALKRHTAEKDETMVDVDEKTIIDKVLKQKKKWKK